LLFTFVRYFGKTFYATAEKATATANNIAAHELLFRLGIVSDLFCGN
jgi:hypothetical protein